VSLPCHRDAVRIGTHHRLLLAALEPASHRLMEFNDPARFVGNPMLLLRLGEVQGFQPGKLAFFLSG